MMTMMRLLRKQWGVTIVVGVVLGLFGCLEKEYFPERPVDKKPVGLFGVFNIHLTLISSETKEPIPDLLVQLSDNGTFQVPGLAVTAEQVTDSTGFIFLCVAAAPPVPQEFVFTLSDTSQTRLFQQEYLSIRFINPVFKYIQKDAAAWGSMYQGTAEMIVTRELKEADYEHKRF